MVHARSKNEEAWRSYRAMIESGGRPKLHDKTQNMLGAKAEFARRPLTADMFDWGSPPTRRALFEIEQSQDEAAKRLACVAH